MHSFDWNHSFFPPVNQFSDMDRSFFVKGFFVYFHKKNAHQKAIKPSKQHYSSMLTVFICLNSLFAGSAFIKFTIASSVMNSYYKPGHTWAGDLDRGGYRVSGKKVAWGGYGGYTPPTFSCLKRSNLTL